jgi:hypothetical protein
MTLTCQLIEVKEPSGVKGKKEQGTRTCMVCSNEPDMIIDLHK